MYVIWRLQTSIPPCFLQVNGQLVPLSLWVHLEVHEEQFSFESLTPKRNIIHLLSSCLEACLHCYLQKDVYFVGRRLSDNFIKKWLGVQRMRSPERLFSGWPP